MAVRRAGPAEEGRRLPSRGESSAPSCGTSGPRRAPRSTWPPLVAGGFEAAAAGPEEAPAIAVHWQAALGAEQVARLAIDVHPLDVDAELGVEPEAERARANRERLAAELRRQHGEDPVLPAAPIVPGEASRAGGVGAASASLRVPSDAGAGVE